MAYTILWDLTPNLSLLDLLLFPLHRLYRFGNFSDKGSFFCPQALSICCFLCLESSSSRSWHRSFLTAFSQKLPWLSIFFSSPLHNIYHYLKRYHLLFFLYLFIVSLHEEVFPWEKDFAYLVTLSTVATIRPSKQQMFNIC